MLPPRLYNGVRVFYDSPGPSPDNVRRLDMGAMPMICYMQQNGLQVDVPHFQRMRVDLTRDMEAITEQVHTITGHYLNLDSGDQVADLLFKKMGLKQARVKMTPSGDRESVAEEVLVPIKHEHPVISKILDFKELSKLRGTYVEGILECIQYSKDGGDRAHRVHRVYPNFKTTRVPSGRLSCAEPNLLAMPNRTARGRDIRKGFICPDGWVYVSVDESQIEVRLAAHCSGDESLIRVYENEEDIYSDGATAFFSLKDERHQDATGWHYPTVHKQDHRFPAKTCILASIYDVSPPGLLEQMPVICKTCRLPAEKHTCGRFIPLWNEENCGQLIAAFYRKYPGILSDRRVHHQRARRHAMVWDMWGRLLHVGAVRSVLPWVAGAALRECGNFPYQSGAQGTIKLTMAQVWDDIVGMGMLEVVQPALQIHDEILFVCREDMAEDIIELVVHRFENCVKLRVPIKASGAKANTWGDIEK